MEAKYLAEYDAAAEWCAKRNLFGTYGDRLPHLLNGNVVAEINADPEAFERRVREFAYGLAMDALKIADEK